MAETPLGRMARLVGGIVLTQGRLGHQILGQLLLFDTDEAAVAGATVVVAATSRQRNAIAQAAIRTAAPAIAVRVLLNRDFQRLEAEQLLIAERLRRVKEREEAIGARERDTAAGAAPVLAARRLLAPRIVRQANQQVAELEQKRDTLEQERQALDQQRQALERERDQLRADVAALTPAATSTTGGPSTVVTTSPVAPKIARTPRKKAGPPASTGRRTSARRKRKATSPRPAARKKPGRKRPRKP